MKRVFKTKTFERWARKVLSDEYLCKAAREIEQGLFEADLGSGVCKKRVAVQGQGKSGATRTLVAKVIASGLAAADAKKLDELLAAEFLKEICNV